MLAKLSRTNRMLARTIRMLAISCDMHDLAFLDAEIKKERNVPTHRNINRKVAS